MNKNKNILKRINEIIVKYRFWGDNDKIYEELDDNYSGDYLYTEFYALKYFSQKYGFNIDKLRNAKNYDEYIKIYEDEIEKVKSYYDIKWLDFYIKWFYDGKEEIYDFIKELNIEDFNIKIEADNWITDEYIDSLIDYSKCKNILSIYSVFYSDKISDDTEVKVMYGPTLDYDIQQKILRFEIKNIHNYSTEYIDSFPFESEQKYDFVYLDLNEFKINLLSRTSSILYEEETMETSFVGDEPNTIIKKLTDYLTDEGIAILDVPLYLISKLQDDILSKNILDKIVYHKKKKDCVNGIVQDTVYVYLVISKNRQDDETIEIKDLVTDQSKFITKKLIQANNNNINLYLYFGHNPKTKKMYDIKDDSIYQKEIIDRETKLIDKLMDEFDFK